MLYRSKVLDMNAFGYYKFSNGILAVDATENVIYRISFDGGVNYMQIKPYEEFSPSSGARIVLEIEFTGKGNKNEFPILVTGVFPLNPGTTVYFNDGKTSQSTVLGFDGRYNISLRPGLYSVHYMKNGSRVQLLENYDPKQYALSTTNDLDKENLIEGFLSRISWAEVSVFDTFVDASKMQPTSTAKIDITSKLVDQKGNFVSYWALALS